MVNRCYNCEYFLRSGMNQFGISTCLHSNERIGYNEYCLNYSVRGESSSCSSISSSSSSESYTDKEKEEFLTKEDMEL